MSCKDDLEKPFSELCVISEDEKYFQGIIEWHVPETEFMQFLQNCQRKGKPIISNTFSIGSSHLFHFRIQPQKFTGGDETYPLMDLSANEMVDVCIVFHKKVPECAWIKGEIYFDNLNCRKTFSVSANSFSKSIDFKGLSCISDLSNRLHSATGLILHCSIKISMKEVKCAFDKDKVSFSESRNYTSNKESFKCDAFSDVSISIDDHLFMTHKALLAQIPYFQELFDANKSEKYFELSNIQQNAFNHILTFLYSGDIPQLNFKLACELYIVASDLKILDLKCLCSSYLGANLTETNAIIVLKLSHEYEDVALKRECFKFIKNSDVETLTAKSIVL